MKIEPAFDRLIERYGDTRPEKPIVRGYAALATVTVNRKGELVESPAVAISSFGWGVMAALSGELADLASWPEVEPRLAERIEKLLLRMASGDQDGREQRVRPVPRGALFAAYEALISELRLPGNWVEPPQFAIRSYPHFKDPNPPEPLLLNSFFLADLALARKLFREDKATANLRRYLGVSRAPASRDLLRDTNALAGVVSPELTPLARWPGPGRRSLVLLQQAAVNAAFRETQAGGLIGINGPPGTGKTTLLRDLVAGVVAHRAEVMAKFDDPETAFEHSGQRLRAGNSWIHLYRLEKALRGFEMVVASSNNKAVENVSAELPGLKSIAEDAPGLRYFKTLSDALHQSETWGAIAAVLGNAQNRSRFKNTFWWDDDKGLNSYLSAALGSTSEVEESDPEAGQMQHRIPRIVEVEQPPSSRDEAAKRWNSARRRFKAALDKSREWQTWLSSLSKESARLAALAQSEVSARAKRDAAAATSGRLEIEVTGLRQEEARAADRLRQTEQELRTLRSRRPGFWERLIRTTCAREWTGAMANLRHQYGEAGAKHTTTTAERRRIEDQLQKTVVECRNTATAWQTAYAHYQQAKQRLQEAEQKYGVVLADGAFFAMDHSKKHQATPWFPSAAQKVRDELFISSIALHRAFVDAAAKPLRHNLNALMNVFTNQNLRDAEKPALLPDLWASLFLVVPLVSTTFASVNRMLGKLPPESLGWLLVDEAGQALPQAAVGAIFRTQRAVIVGDPVQIEPVVLLPDALTHAILRRFGVDPDGYAAPSASAQTLADASSSYRSEFETRVGSRTVGVPLLVHRRCSEPMFSISNAIAYSGLMVSAKSPRSSDISDLLGPSRWIHVEGSGEDKWCPEEGLVVLELLRKMATAKLEPDLYIISPFVIVAGRMREMVRESRVLQGWIEEDDWAWTTERIGTVHTAQGREAEAVILVLGAPDARQTGARNWAGARPNLPNVAVSRAKEVVYVIGNRKLWRDAGLFRELDRRLP